MNNVLEQFSAKKPIIISFIVVVVLGLLFGFFFKTNWGRFYSDYLYMPNEVLWLAILFAGIFWQLLFFPNSRKAFMVNVILPILTYAGFFIYIVGNYGFEGERMLGLWAGGITFFLPIFLLALGFNYLYKKRYKKLFISALLLLSIILLGVAWNTAGSHFAGFMQADNTPPQNINTNQCWKLLFTSYVKQYDRCKNITLEERIERYDAVTKDSITITLYFPKYQNGYGWEYNNECGIYGPETMQISYTSKIEDATLKQLFLHGHLMLKDYYQGITIQNGVAVISFEDDAIEYLKSTDCAQESYKNSIEKTLKTFNYITEVRYAIDGKIFTN